MMTPPSDSMRKFNLDFQRHIQHLELKGLQPKTVESYARAIHQIGSYFDNCITDLSEQQLADYFSSLLSTHSWSTVKINLCGLKFFYRHVLHKPWKHLDLIKPPRSKRLPNILTIEQVAKLFNTTKKLSYRVFYFTVYSLGLRLNEGLHLKVGDIDAQRHRVHIRDAKGNKDRFVPLPDTTLDILRRFWSVHRNPVLLFPNRSGGLKSSHSAIKFLDQGGVQATLRKVVEQCGIKKRLPPIACATAMQPI